MHLQHAAQLLHQKNLVGVDRIEVLPGIGNQARQLSLGKVKNMKSATHLNLPATVRVGAKVRAMLTGRTLTQYVSDLISADLAAWDAPDSHAESSTGEQALTAKRGAQ